MIETPMWILNVDISFTNIFYIVIGILIAEYSAHTLTNTHTRICACVCMCLDWIEDKCGRSMNAKWWNIIIGWTEREEIRWLFVDPKVLKGIQSGQVVSERRCPPHTWLRRTGYVKAWIEPVLFCCRLQRTCQCMVYDNGSLGQYRRPIFSAWCPSHASPCPNFYPVITPHFF